MKGSLWWVCFWLFVISLNTCTLSSRLSGIQRVLERQESSAPMDWDSFFDLPERGGPLPGDKTGEIKSK